MTKRIACTLVAIGLVGSALAQEKDYKNAPFVGVSVGSSKITRTIQRSTSTTTMGPSWTEDPDNPGFEVWDPIYSTSTTSDKIEESPSGIYVGIIGGYRYFMSPELAIRGYGELEYHPVRIISEDESEESSKYINFIVGADALYYFKQSDDFDVAAFAGLGLAFSRFDSKMLFASKNAAGIMLNVGVHADINERHGVDVGVKFFSNKVNDNMSNSIMNVTYDYEVEIKQNHAIFARYTFSF